MGRSPDNDLILRDPATSGHHARVERRGEQFWVVDLGSTNGTLVNGEPVPGKGAKPRRPDHHRPERDSLRVWTYLGRSNAMRLRIAWATDPGLEREENEDAVAVWRNKAGLDTLLVVCDGMGGHAAGQPASSIASKTITRCSPRTARKGSTSTD